MTPMKASEPVRKSLLTYAFARSALYQAEGLMAPAIEAIVTRKRPRLLFDDKELFKAARGAMEELLKNDVERIVAGVYPVEVLRPGSPIRHLLRIPAMFREGLAIARRRRSKKAHEFSAEARDLLEGLPEYYQRNFHFQGDGYLSGHSAELYDHQVDVLFAGTSDAMRRLIIAPMKAHFGGGDGEGLKFLEVGAGTGRTAQFIRLAFPRAKITALDLSAPYLKKAQARLMKYPRHDYVEADAAHLPFLDESFDAVYSTFLFHELPMQTRREVLTQAKRVLRDGGFVGMVDSLQIGDVPAFDDALEQFPKDFHEPFYKSYVDHPMERLFEESGFEAPSTETGFFSKVVTSRKS
ncbi:MAG: methyltransferase domain-containing protein [Bdellovibrionota bacterium]